MIKPTTLPNQQTSVWFVAGLLLTVWKVAHHSRIIPAVDKYSATVLRLRHEHRAKSVDAGSTKDRKLGDVATNSFSE
jgi:hypothetical protein